VGETFLRRCLRCALLLVFVVTDFDGIVLYGVSSVVEPLPADHLPLILEKEVLKKVL